jgi:hypothetical protein
LISALCELQHQPFMPQKVADSLKWSKKQPKAKDKHPKYKEPPTCSVNTIQCTRFVELVMHAITSQSAYMYNCLRIRDSGRQSTHSCTWLALNYAKKWQRKGFGGTGQYF